MTTRWVSRHRMALVGAVSLAMGLLLASRVGGDFQAIGVVAAVLSTLLALGGAVLVYLDLRLPRHEVWSVSFRVKLPLYGSLLLLGVVGLAILRPLLSGSTATFSAQDYVVPILCAIAAIVCGALHLFAVQREYYRRARRTPRICTRCSYPMTEGTGCCSECGQSFAEAVD